MPFLPVFFVFLHTVPLQKKAGLLQNINPGTYHFAFLCFWVKSTEFRQTVVVEVVSCPG